MACRRRAGKDSLIRLVRSPEGEVRWDPDARAPGRGAYMCPSGACFEEAVRRGRLARTLRTRLGALDVERLRREAPRELQMREGTG